MQENIGKLKNEHGFSLIEAIVVIIILGIITAVAGGLLHTQTATYSRVFNRSLLMFEGRNALSVIRSDLQELTSDSIKVMLPEKLSFRDKKGNLIKFEYSGNKIKRNNSIIAQYVQTAPFQYLDYKIKVVSTSKNL